MVTCMGFGSYDESEQQDVDADFDDDDAVQSRKPITTER